LRGFITSAIESGFAAGESAKQPVKQEEADAEISVHESVIIDHMVMAVVPAARRDEPMIQPFVFFHPKPLDMHNVVQIAEHHETPQQCGCEVDPLINR
jgi:hypothetical protein